MPGANWIRNWPGGRVRTVDGREVFVLERMHRGQRHVYTLNVSSEPEALAELALWRRDPVAYRAKRLAPPASDESVTLTDPQRLADFLASMQAEGLTIGYRKCVKKYLNAWAKALGSRDLRSIPLRDLRAQLRKWPKARKWRIIALKAFTAWLKEEDILRPQEDPTLALYVPASRPAKATDAKGYPRAVVEAIYAHIGSQAVRDVILLRAKTGMHGSEIRRVASGLATLRRVDDPCGIVGTVRFLHKSKRIHMVSLDAQAFAAAERLVARGHAPADSTMHECLQYLADREELPKIDPGELRHSFVTWALAEGELIKPTPRGVPIEQVQAIVAHTSKSTTSTFYDGTEIPAMVRLPLALVHPRDPLTLTRARYVKAT